MDLRVILPEEGKGTPEAAAKQLSSDAAPFEILRRFVVVIRQNSFLIAAIFTVCLTSAALITMSSNLKYLATATIRIEPEAATITGNPQDIAKAPTAQETERQLQTQVDIARSRALASKVANDLRLYKMPDFAMRMGQDGVEKAHAPLSLIQTRHRQVEDLLTTNLQVVLPRGTRIAQLRFESPDPVLAAKIASGYANALITGNLEGRMEGSQYAQDYLADQLERAKAQFEQSERKSIAYATQAGLIGSNGNESENTPNLSAISLIQVSADHNTARTTRIRAEQTYRVARGTPLLAVPGVQANQALQTVIAHRTQLLSEVTSNRRIFADEYPEQAKRLEELASLNSQVDTLARSSLVALRQNYRAAAGEEAALAQQVARLRNDSLAEQAKAVRYNILKRESDTYRALYETLLARYNNIGAEAAATNNNISLLDAAAIPYRPVSPRLGVNLALAMILAFILSAGLVLIRTFRGT